MEGTELLSVLGVEPGGAVDHTQIASLDHLQEAFMSSFSRGGAAERPFTDSELFTTVVDKASSLKTTEVVCNRSMEK